MPQEVGNRLALLPRMTKAQLLALWKELFRVPPPRRTRTGLLIKFLAHRMQEQAYGGLSPATRKRLRELARKFETNPNAELSGAPRIKPGTRLIRDWRGQSHRVTVLENGHEYAGKRYSSFSQVARLITGGGYGATRKNGFKSRLLREFERLVQVSTARWFANRPAAATPFKLNWLYGEAHWFFSLRRRGQILFRIFDEAVEIGRLIDARQQLRLHAIKIDDVVFPTLRPKRLDVFPKIWHSL